MGITSHDIQLLEEIIPKYNIKSCTEFGAQYLYDQDYGRIKFAKEWFGAKGIRHTSIDWNREGDLNEDLSRELHGYDESDLVTDFGTLEHIEDIYTGLKNAHNLCSKIMIHENPKTGNWKNHGDWYFDKQFYIDLAKAAGYKIIRLEEVPAMNNTTDGWNILTVLQKTKFEFISFNEFKKIKCYNE